MMEEEDVLCEQCPSQDYMYVRLDKKMEKEKEKEEAGGGGGGVADIPHIRI